jgi:hypothetical protein
MLTILLTVFVITTIYGFRHVILAYLPPFAVHVTVALAEGLRGSAFGLTVLGDKTGDVIANKTIFGLGYTTGLFPGGFFGTSRSLLAVLLLIVPVAAVIIVDRYEGTVRWWLLMLVPTTFILILADTASGLGGYLLLLGLVCGYGLLVRITSANESQSLVAAGAAVLNGFLIIIFSQFSRYRGESESTEALSDNQDRSSGSSGGQNTPSSGSSGGQGTQPDTDGSALFELLPPFLTDNLGIRVWLASTALTTALQYPLFGLGGANFELVSEELGLQYGLTPHNTYLSVLAEFGIPGFLLFLSAVGYTYYATFRLAREQSTHKEMWAMVVAGLFAFHAFNFWVSIYHSSTVYAVFWSFAAAVAGEYATECKPSCRVRRIQETLTALR